MTEIEYRLADLINFSSHQKPIEFETALTSILASKITNAVAEKKLEISQTMFRTPEEYSREEDYSDE